MTDKRFTIKEIDNFNRGIQVTNVILDKDIELSQSTVCDLLNELHEENMKLVNINIYLCKSIEEDMRVKK